jgi:hypothetical protein
MRPHAYVRQAKRKVSKKEVCDSEHEIDEPSQSRIFGHAQVKNSEEGFVETSSVEEEEEDEHLNRKPAARVLQPKMESPSRKVYEPPQTGRNISLHEIGDTDLDAFSMFY